MTSRIQWLAAVGNGPIAGGNLAQVSTPLLYPLGPAENSYVVGQVQRKSYSTTSLARSHNLLLKVAEDLHTHFSNNHHRASRDGSGTSMTNGLRHMESSYRLCK